MWWGAAPLERRPSSALSGGKASIAAAPAYSVTTPPPDGPNTPPQDAALDAQYQQQQQQPHMGPSRCQEVAVGFYAQLATTASNQLQFLAKLPAGSVLYQVCLSLASLTPLACATVTCSQSFQAPFYMHCLLIAQSQSAEQQMPLSAMFLLEDSRLPS